MRRRPPADGQRILGVESVDTKTAVEGFLRPKAARTALGMLIEDRLQVSQ